MAEIYPESKVYFDGSHFIGIEPCSMPKRKMNYRTEKKITIAEEDKDMVKDVISKSVEIKEKDEKSGNKSINDENEVRMTKKELFNALYDKYSNLKKDERKKTIYDKMRKYFKSDEKCLEFVERNLERKRRNDIARKVRLWRKASLQTFNYFCTFTYDDNKITEEEFKKRLLECLHNFSTRKNWKYIGVWERGSETDRLHFHGMFYIPDGTMPGYVLEQKDYNFKTHQIKTTLKNTYFEEKFGRNDFENITSFDYSSTISYITKYMDKSGNRAVFSRSLPEYLKLDLLDDDVIIRMSKDPRKMILVDDFECIVDGEMLGKYSEDIKERIIEENAISERQRRKMAGNNL